MKTFLCDLTNFNIRRKIIYNLISSNRSFQNIYNLINETYQTKFIIQKLNKKKYKLKKKKS